MKRIIIAMICVLGVVQANVARSEDLTTITLDEALVFAAPNGDVVNVAPGIYDLELAEAGGLKLIPPPDDAAVIVAATRSMHDLDVAEPVARVIADDEVATHVVLVLPGGEFADAVGSRGGVLGRGSR